MPVIDGRKWKHMLSPRLGMKIGKNKSELHKQFDLTVRVPLQKVTFSSTDTLTKGVFFATPLKPARVIFFF